MTPLLIQKGRHALFLDRNGGEGFVRVADLALFLNADDLAHLGSAATGLSRELKREQAYKALESK